MLSIEAQVKGLNVSFLLPVPTVHYKCKEEYGAVPMSRILWPSEDQLPPRQTTRQRVNHISVSFSSHAVAIPRSSDALKSYDVALAGFSTTLLESALTEDTNKLEKSGNHYKKGAKNKQKCGEASSDTAEEEMPRKETIIMKVKVPFYLQAAEIENVKSGSNSDVHEEISFFNVPGFDDIPPIDFMPMYPLNLSPTAKREEQEESKIHDADTEPDSKEPSTFSLTEQDEKMDTKGKKSKKQRKQAGKKLMENTNHEFKAEGSTVNTHSVDTLEKSFGKKGKKLKGERRNEERETEDNSKYMKNKNSKSKEAEISSKKGSKKQNVKGSSIQSLDMKELMENKELESVKTSHAEGSSEVQKVLLEEELEPDSWNMTELFKPESTSTISTLSPSEGSDIEWPSVICFTGLPSHQAFKKTFVVRNETPLPSSITVTVENFHERNDTTQISMIERIQMKIAGRLQDEWKYRIPKNTGIVFVVEPSATELGPHETVPVDIWVYADTWGTYHDQIVCHVAGLPPFYIQLTAEVVGFPLSFPMADGGINSESILRFGALAYQGSPQIRRVRIKNKSCIRININWHIFLEDDNNTSHPPFTILLDFLDPTPKMEPGFKLKSAATEMEDSSMLLNLDSYHGKEEFTVFQIRPRNMSIPARGEATFLVKVSPIISSRYITEALHVKAVAVGHIRLAQHAREAEGLFFRPSGMDMKPVKLHMDVTIETPLLNLHLTDGDLTLDVNAPDIVYAPNEIYTVYRSLIFCNDSQAPLTARVQASKPFEVVRVSTLDNSGMQVVRSDNYMVLNSGHSVEILIKCNLNRRYIEKGLLTLKQNYSMCADIKYMSEKAVTVERELSFILRSRVNQSVQLRVNIAFPSLVIKADLLDFGPVYVQNTRRLILEIRNQSDFDVWINIWKKNDTEEFSIVPTCALLPAAAGISLKMTEIEIFFKPSDTKEYQEKIVVQTCVPGDWPEVILLGVGSLNARFDMPGF